MSPDDEKRLVGELKKGSEFKKIHKKGDVSKLRMKISEDGFYLLHGKKQVLLADIEEIRFGQNTDGFARNQKGLVQYVIGLVAAHRSFSDRPCRFETTSFSVIFWGQSSLDLIASTSNEFILWTLGLKLMIGSNKLRQDTCASAHSSRAGVDF